jgi:hypothetical protein
MQQTLIGRSGLQLWIPRAWSVFSYKGYVYVRVDSCTFAYQGPVTLNTRSIKRSFKTAQDFIEISRKTQISA